jgi:hypothetical protein
MILSVCRKIENKQRINQAINQSINQCNQCNHRISLFRDMLPVKKVERTVGFVASTACSPAIHREIEGSSIFKIISSAFEGSIATEMQFSEH